MTLGTPTIVNSTLVLSPLFWRGLCHCRVSLPVRILPPAPNVLFVILANVLPFSEKSACGNSTVLHGIQLCYLPQPVHSVHVKSKLAGVFPVAVCSALPIKGIALLMGNDAKWSKITSTLEVLGVLRRHTGKVGTVPNSNLISSRSNALFLSMKDKAVTLSDDFPVSDFTDETETENKPCKTHKTAGNTVAAQVCAARAASSPRRSESRV